MDNSRKIIVLALMIAVTSAVEIQDAGSFPTGTDYQNEKTKEGHDPTNYKKTYHKVIPGGSEHAEVIASNGPNSNSFSQTYSKHQSFGSADTMQSQDAMDRHNAIMSSIQRSMGGMGMGAPMAPFGKTPLSNSLIYVQVLQDLPSQRWAEMPKTNTIHTALLYSFMMYSDSGFDDWMRNHMRMMDEMMRMQNAQIQALQQLIASSSYPRKSSPYSAINPTEIRYQNPKTVDGEASVRRSSRGF
ncbi:hypothetical protein CAEBREN_09122 [Caenorhabditis brenneri]|uniref:Uncharacterized protein n=1 Tax=Caenorhabditis brenneri TaxID=135651 RepID=G0PLF9_CAEBE|nr:hypothetical protein CAEBREN_09122 [Caenorhabditis brenneri]